MFTSNKNILSSYNKTRSKICKFRQIIKTKLILIPMKYSSNLKMASLTPVEGYFGQNCEFGPCDSLTCMNGGLEVQNGPLCSCFCPNGFSGAFCEVTPCDPDPCQNSGTCSISGENFSCACEEGYSGPTCEETPCTSQPCLNGGTCEVDGSNYQVWNK